MSVFFPSVSIVIHGSNKCPHSHPRLSPSPSIIQSFILSIASIMGKPQVPHLWGQLGWDWGAAAAMKGYLHLNDCWWDGDGMILPHFLMRTEHMNWDSWGDWWSRFIGERNKLLFVCCCDYWHAAVVAVTILSAVCQVNSCCCPAVAGAVCIMFMFVIIVSTGLTIYDARPSPPACNGKSRNANANDRRSWYNVCSKLRHIIFTQ